MLVVLLFLGAALLVVAALAILFLRMALTVFEFLCTAMLFAILLSIRRPAIGIALVFSVAAVGIWLFVK